MEPERATARALARAAPPDAAPAVFAFGKAAHGMVRAAVAWLDAHGLALAGGLVVAHHAADGEPLPLESLVADHPVPGARSLAAADRLGAVIRSLPARAPALVFLSGGSSSLLAAPLEGISPDDLTSAFDVFHDLGLPIHTMNALRRQLTRWSGGRLAAALGARDMRAWVISDVVDNDLGVIGSGPLVGGPIDADTLVRVLTRPDLVERIPGAVLTALAAGAPPDVREIPHHLVADRTMAGEAAVRSAQAEGVKAMLHDSAITGDVHDAATRLAEWIAHHVTHHSLPDRSTGVLVEPVPREPRLHVWTGETTVRLPPDHGTGGRAQQLALLVARELEAMARRGIRTHTIQVLVAGTDGRDGPTDAAGAIVDRETVARIVAAGIDVDHAIARCDAHAALDAAGALLRTGATGTNVADVVMVLGRNWY